MLYGAEVMGISDSLLTSARGAASAAISTDVGGKTPDLVLLFADAAGTRTDPAFEAHAMPVKYMAMSWWERWQPRDELIMAFNLAVAKLRSVKRSVWDKVAGPMAAFVATVWRLGWVIHSPSTFLTDSGDKVDLELDSPAAVTTLVYESVRRWQLLKAVSHFPGAVPPVLDAGSEPVLISFHDGPQCYRPPDLHCYYSLHARLPPSVVGCIGALGKLAGGKAVRSKVVDGWERQFAPYLRSAFVGGQWPQLRIAQRAGDDVDTLCQLCKSQVGTLEHRRECPATLPLEGWPRPSTRVHEFMQRLSPERRQLVLNRGLLVTRMAIPLPSADGWMKWIKPPPQDSEADWTFYIDGSLIDGPSKRFARAGFAIAIVSAGGDLVAFALGVPPAWVRSAPAAEAWALLNVFLSCPAPPRIVTDCLNLIVTLNAGCAAATGAKRPLARLWGMIFRTLDGGIDPGDVEKVLLWMPSHGSKTVIGHATKSDGSAVSALDWRANRLVDALAKIAAGRGRIDVALRTFWSTACEAVEFCAATLGMVTYAANNVRESAQRADGSYVYARRRDACPIPFLNPAQRPLRRTTRGLDGTTTTTTAPDAPAPPPAPTTGTDAEEQGHHDASPTTASSASGAFARQPPPATAAHASSREQDAHASQLAALARGAKARAAAAQALHEERAQARFAQTWHLDRAAAAAQRAPQPATAQDRLAALRLRVLARQANERL